MITEEEIEKAKTSKGGFTKAQLSKWGVIWPPVRGWKKKLLAEQAEQDGQAS